MQVPDSPEVMRNEAASRFEATVDGWLCVADYRIESGCLVLPSVRVPPAVEGRGIAGSLTRAALDWAAGQGMDVLPLCPYVQAWLRRHPGHGASLCRDGAGHGATTSVAWQKDAAGP